MDTAETASENTAREEQAASAAAPTTAGIRELIDELVLVFVLVMFLKTFLVEHYKIPTGSMTPTLIGGKVAYVKFDDGKKGLAYWSNDNLNDPPLVYVKDQDRYLLAPERRVDTDELLSQEAVRQEYDHVLVSRLAYWFHQPRRGDVVVFKVPPAIYKPDSPIYIKRCVGEPGDVLSFTQEGRLIANGKLVEKPEFFKTQRYLTTFSMDDNSPDGIPQVRDMEEDRLSPFTWRIASITVPKTEAYVFGDNSTPRGSWDSRYWGGAPLENFKGRAFVRVWPLNQAGFLH